MVLRRFVWLVLILVLAYFVILHYKDIGKIINYREEMKQPDELISREILFGNPDKMIARLSDDGNYISFVAPSNEVLNIWVAPIDRISDAIPITDDKQRGIRSYYWSKDNKNIIYAQDKEGDENWRLYSINVETKDKKDLTPSDGTRASILKLSRKYNNEALVLINDRVPEYFDVYKIDLTTGERTLVYENVGKYSSFLADDDFKIRFGYKMLPNGEGELYLFKDGDIEKNASLFQRIDVEDMLTTNPLHISSDGSRLFMMDSAGKNTSALVEIDIFNGDKKIIYQNDKADIADYIVDTKTKLIQGVATNYLRKTWVILDKNISNDIDSLKKIDDGDLEIISRTYEDDKWIVVFIKSDDPFKYYLYDRTTKKAKFLFVSNSKLENQPLAKKHPVVIKSRDGLNLISYLTVPRWLDNGAGIPTTPVPLILYVHGGPNTRDVWGLDSISQWLSNRGYAVLNVNYRGSTGFGKSFINAGDGEWARKMQDDLEDGVNWCIENKITQRDKVVIMGGSYGGYAALVGMTMTPDMYLAGIDIVGPSNLETLVKSIPPYWKPEVAHLNKIIGATADTEEGTEFLKERSPLTYVKNIKKPLLIVQGANDPRVKQAESDQIVDAMKELGIPVVYLLYSDEGHGLARPENRLSMYAYAEVFLANFAGGRLIKHSNEFPGSSVIVKEGKDITWIKDKK